MPLIYFALYFSSLNPLLDVTYLVSRLTRLLVLDSASTTHLWAISSSWILHVVFVYIIILVGARTFTKLYYKC